MDYEKKYKEVLENARTIVENKNASSVWKDWLCNTFPELAESEDERIKGAIIDHLKDSNLIEWAAWLEKQGKQKPIIDGILTATNYDKMFQNCNVHKFNVGDWIVFNGLTLLVNEVVQGYYRTITIGGIPCSYDWDIDNIARLWTIQDAKDGDVLASKDGLSILIFRNLDTSTSFSSYYNIQGKGELGWSNECFIPATKEQSDLLFQKMKEAGYVWDANKKKIENTYQKLGEFISELSKQFPDVSFAKLSRIAVRVAKWVERNKCNKQNE